MDARPAIDCFQALLGQTVQLGVKVMLFDSVHHVLPDLYMPGTGDFTLVHWTKGVMRKVLRKQTKYVKTPLTCGTKLCEMPTNICSIPIELSKILARCLYRNYFANIIYYYILS